MIKKLEWDSEFFRYKVGFIRAETSCMFEINEALNTILDENYKLCYLASSEEMDFSQFDHKDLEIKFVDRKVTYLKTVDSLKTINPAVTSIEQFGPNDRILNIAIQSGEYSRFNVDKNIEEGKFEELYQLWIQNSINRELAFDVLGFQAQGGLAGFVTLKETKGRADIGLIAVDGLYRGQGIGKSLMSSAEKWVDNLGFKELQVVTQGENIPACKFYESCGYQLEQTQYYYHVWNKNIK
ncbi:MAG: GNAT family N-acetyltransferase [Flavobacteriales bacterium]|jgi:dTDP-4-amino-4,6-dideoxy-D-galactose acyltransferase|nr:GNAT family N-acetyltransferase [Flavobacteriales bacterium]